jgi:tRNA threonylcarbamoyladenosine biosynthesis protein TsaE
VSAPSALHLATRTVDSPDATRDVGRQLASLLEPGDIVLIEGDLGAGKTTFVQGLAEGLGVKGHVASPTFTLMRVLVCGEGRAVRRLLHADLYRLEHLQEVVDLGLVELVDEDAVAAVAAVEWGDAGAPVLGNEVLEVLLEPGAGENDRVITISGTESWAARAEAVTALLGRRA